MKELLSLIDELYEVNAYHVKRGFRLKEATSLMVSNHLLEEAVELQSEIMANNREAIVEEAGDVIVLFARVLRTTDVGLDEVLTFATKKLNKIFTTDPNKVTAISPGTSRRARK